jgi:hypothetical protein
MNSVAIDLVTVTKGALSRAVSKGRAVAGGIVFGCDGFAPADAPTTFEHKQVQVYVLS